MEVTYEVREKAAWIEMNRPGTLNALSKSMFLEMKTSLESGQKDPGVRFVVFTGAGSAFSAGLDVKEVGGFKSKSEARSFVFGLVKPFWESLFSCDKPVISMVNGAAYGAGAEIALASDIVIASANAKFAFSGGRVGALCCISGILGPMLMSGRKLVEMNLTGAPVSAREALELGLVSRVVSDRDLLGSTRALLRDLRKVSPVSNASFKRIFRTAVSKEKLEDAYSELFRTITSREFQEGARAFREKRPPIFYG